MTNESFYALPLGVLFLAIVLLLLGALEAGYQFGKRRHQQRSEEKDQPVVAVVGSILGIVALVLGFTFNLAASRFDARRQAVLVEANAIRTTYLRAQFLPKENRTEVEKLLREYVDVRLSTAEPGKLASAITRSEELQTLLWTQAVAADSNSASITHGLFIQSLNEVIALNAKRMMVGIWSQIPLPMWLGLLALTMLGLMSVGYECGLCATRRTPVMLGMVIAFAIVLLMIMDFDRAQDGMLRVGQQAMIDLQKSMQTSER